MKHRLKFVTVEEFEKIWDRVAACMIKNAERKGFQLYRDYDVYWPYNGWSQVLLEIFNLEILSGRLVERLRGQIRDQPNWEIVVAIDIPAHRGDWPRMGLRIRSNEVVDDLQREYFPEDLQSLRFAYGRPGTPADR